MKSKFLLLVIGLAGFVAARANNVTCTHPGDGKKDEMNGTVVHAETKKPVKDVSVTAYLVSRKEKVVVTNEDGGFAFDELRPGTYKFVFEKAGFRKIIREKIVIKTDEAFQLNIEMIEQKDYEIMPSPFHMGGIK